MKSTIIGLDLSEHGICGVLLDADSGQVLKRATTQGEGGLARALKQLGGAGAAAAIGVAAERGTGLAADKALARKASVWTPGAAAINAETWIGQARGAQDAVCLWLGARVFAGLMLGGRHWAGAHGLAGSVAWLALNPVERQDYRKFGSLAAEVSTIGIARRLCWRIQSGDRSAVLDRAGTIAAITAADVFDGARNGDGVAISVIRETARYIAMAIANLSATVDPEVIVIAGELAQAGDLLLEPITQECARRLPPAIMAHFRLELSTLGADGIAIGAARLAAAS